MNQHPANILITGATDGIGYETARQLADRGHRVTIVGRDPDKGHDAARSLHVATGNDQVSFEPADLSSQEQIRDLARRVRASHDRLDVLVNNVGGLFTDRWETVDGIEATLALSHLAGFQLTNELLPLLKTSAPARIVNVSTGAASRGDLRHGKFTEPQPYHGLQIYADAKLASLAWTLHLARELDGTGVVVHAVDPGGADTDMQRNTPLPAPLRAVTRLLRPLLRLAFPIDKAAHSSVVAATDDQLAANTGLFLNREGRPKRPPEQATDRTLQDQVAQISANLIETLEAQP